MSITLNGMKNDVDVKQRRVRRLEKELEVAKEEFYKAQKRLTDNCPHTNTTELISTGYDQCDDCGELI